MSQYERLEYGILFVIWQGTHSNCISKLPVFSLFFPCLIANFSYVNLCQLWLQCIPYTKLIWQTYPAFLFFFFFFFFWGGGVIFAANIEIPFPVRIREFTTWANQIPCVSAKFPNSLCFPWQGFFFAIFPVFPVFPVKCVPCMGIQLTYSHYYFFRAEWGIMPQ